MSDTDRDPFLGDDAAAAEREARRREREARRAEREGRERSEETQRSLGRRAAESGSTAEGGRAAGAAGGSEAGGPQVPSDDAGAAGEGAQPPGGTPASRPRRQPRTEPARPDPAPAGGTEDPGGPEADSREFFRLPRRAPGGESGDAQRLGKEVMRRRLLAGAGVLGVIVLIVLIASASGGGDGEAEQVAGAEQTVETRDVVVPEGLTLSQIAKVAKKANLKGSYEKAAQKPPKGFPAKRYGADDAPDLEGFLFPATYEVEKRAPAENLVNKQLDAFAQNISQVDLKRARKANLTVYDVVKIASMIEREVSVPEERELVSAVIHNRLRDGEPLGIDATLRYELDDFDSPLLESELAADTPYNTRINAGLPPTPIGNPGLASLEAAANPADKNFRFYVVKPGTCNEHVFTADPAEFEAAVAEYQAALAEEGGSPTDCG